MNDLDKKLHDFLYRQAESYYFEGSNAQWFEQDCPILIEELKQAFKESEYVDAKRVKMVLLSGKLAKTKELKDGRLSINFVAGALTEDQLFILAGLDNIPLWCQLSGDTTMSLPGNAPPPLTGGASDSQRMRLAFQSLWSSKYGDQPFEEFYHEQMVRITDKILGAIQNP
jgi:hypothetical protein